MHLRESPNKRKKKNNNTHSRLNFNIMFTKQSEFYTKSVCDEKYFSINSEILWHALRDDLEFRF